MRLTGYQRVGRWQGTRANIVTIAAFADRAAKTGQDIGSSDGLNAFALACCGIKVTATETKTRNHKRAVSMKKRLDVPVEFRNGFVTPEEIEAAGDVGITLLLSVHHLFAAAMGLDAANDFLKLLARKSTSQLFLQPACISAKYKTQMPFEDNDYAAAVSYFDDILKSEMPHSQMVGFSQNDYPKNEPMRPMIIYGRAPIQLQPDADAAGILSRVTKAI